MSSTRAYVWVDGGYTRSEVLEARTSTRRPAPPTLDELERRVSGRSVRELRPTRELVHGTRGGYVRGCRLECCASVERAYQAERWRRDPDRSRRNRAKRRTAA